MRVREIQYPSANGEHDIHALIWRSEREEDIRAVVQIAHGMCEYAQRYENFAAFLAEQGFLVCANDHAGHGGSVRETRGYFGAKNGYLHLVADMHTLFAQVRKEYPDIPYFLLGHSMGSFLARLYCATYGKELTGALFSGTGDAPANLPLALTLNRVVKRLQGAEAEGKIFYALSGQSYNRQFRPNRTNSDWLTRDDRQVDAFIQDQRSQFIFSNAGYGDLFAMLNSISRFDWAGCVPKDLPMFLFSGSEDPVGDKGCGVLKVYRRLVDAGCTDVSLKLYGQGRHEMLNELNRAEVYEDVYRWISSKIPIFFKQKKSMLAESVI